jgi:hypothetical protein
MHWELLIVASDADNRNYLASLCERSVLDCISDLMTVFYTFQSHRQHAKYDGIRHILFAV